MEIINLAEEYEDTYCKCLEDWSEEFKEAGNYKKEWLEKKKPQGLRVKLAKNKKNEIVGMIQYIPIEYSPVKGNDLYYIYCIWVHGYKQGVGNNQKQGIGKLLLKAAEIDSKELGAKGIVAWGITLPFFMRSKWFKKNGYKSIDKDGMIELVWKPFIANIKPPQLIKMIKKPSVEKDIVTITCFRNGWCPAQNLSCERMKRAAGEYLDGIKYIEIDTNVKDNLNEWGMADAIFIDDKQITNGPPPSYEKLQKILKRKMKRIVKKRRNGVQ